MSYYSIIQHKAAGSTMNDGAGVKGCTATHPLVLFHSWTGHWTVSMFSAIQQWSDGCLASTPGAVFSLICLPSRGYNLSHGWKSKCLSFQESSLKYLSLHTCIISMRWVMKEIHRIYWRITFAILVFMSFQSSAHTIPDPNLVEQIAKIKAIDNHSHMKPATADQGYSGPQDWPCSHCWNRPLKRRHQPQLSQLTTEAIQTRNVSANRSFSPFLDRSKPAFSTNLRRQSHRTL